MSNPHSRHSAQDSRVRVRYSKLKKANEKNSSKSLNDKRLSMSSILHPSRRLRLRSRLSGKRRVIAIVSRLTSFSPSIVATKPRKPALRLSSVPVFASTSSMKKSSPSEKKESIHPISSTGRSRVAESHHTITMPTTIRHSDLITMLSISQQSRGLRSSLQRMDT